MEPTPDTHPGDFESVKNSRARRNVRSGELWERNLLHRDHWEVYKNKKKWENGVRDRAVWNDGRLKEQF